MIKPLRFSSLAWWAVPLGALGFLLWINVVRVDHIAHVSAQGGWRAPAAVAAGGRGLAPQDRAVGNGLIVPEQTAASLHWIKQTQRMLQRGEWRLRQIDYENAPFGRAVQATSPYRWWLGLVAWCDHVVTGRSSAQAVERAALVADPLLHGLFLIGTTLFVGWRFGAFPAVLLALGSVASFPFAAEFLPGAPDRRGLAQILAVWSVLLLAAGVVAPSSPKDRGSPARRWFLLAGVTGGLGLWIDVRSQIAVVAGIAAGALLAAWVGRRSPTPTGGGTPLLPWRWWAAGGAITTLLAYLIEFAPAHLGAWQLAVIHPLYGLAWIGVGEVLAQAVAWIQEEKIPRTARQIGALTLAVAAIAAVPVIIWKVHGADFLIPDPSSFRLTRLPDGAVAQSLGAWMVRDGLTLQVWAALLPVLLIVPAVWMLLRRPTGDEARVAGALALGPVLLTLGFACQQLAWWSTLGGLLWVLVVSATSGPWGATLRRRTRGVWLATVLLLLAPGLWQLAGRASGGSKDELTRSELLGLIERDLGAWIALHADPGGVVVLAPPNESTALCYYGGLRGIGSLSWENREGVAAAVRILSAPSFQEAKELIDRREVTHLVLLSWDTYFDDYARAGTGQIEGSFLHALRTWKLPLWLRPVAYQLPTIAGFEGQSVTVLEVVESQNEATALARMAEYFVETGALDQASSTADSLRRFPVDFGALVARAEVELARGDEGGFARSLKLLQSRLGTKTAPPLAWDLRVGLAVVLAKAKQTKLAREQVGLCLAAADERKLRSLSTGALYRFLVLGRVFDLTVDPKLRERAVDLLPGDLRERLR